MKVAYHDEYVHPLPDGHRFPMEKYSLLHRQLWYEGMINESDIISPEDIKDEYLLNIHDENYLDNLFNLRLTPREERISGFVHSEQLIRRERRIMEGTRLCAEEAFQSKVALNIAGGTHHAYSDRGEGFCLLNDQAISAQYLLDANKVKSVLIIDLDVHQGNGTASIFKDEPRVFAFSMHGKNNYPLQKERSDLDVELKDGIEDDEYLYLLQASLVKILSEFKPEFVFYQCGVDIIQTDKLGKLNISLEGARQRDEIVFEYVRQLCVPVVCTMGGGYSPRIADIVNAHTNTFKAAQKILC